MKAPLCTLMLLATSVAAWAAPVFEQLAEFERPPIHPLAPLLYRPSENASYGTTTSGGAFDKGTVFTINGSGVVTTRFSFSGISGAVKGEAPNAGLVAGSNGALFGTTMAGGAGDLGTVYKINVAGAFVPLLDFTGLAGLAPGSVPNDLVIAADGSLYGTTQAGGANDLGTVFKLTPAGVLTILVEFTGTTGLRKGAAPVGALVANGTTLYGVTQAGGANDLGTVFKVSTSGSGFAVLAEFTGISGGRRGSYPAAGLALHSDGKLYGTTEYGGVNDFGTVFQVSTGGSFTNLRQLSHSDGTNPTGALTMGGDLALYGTASAGGALTRGTIFKITNAGVYQVLSNFTGNGGATPGATPRAGLNVGAAGEFQGTTSAGGADDSGTCFKITSAGVFTHLSDFTTVQGWQPSGGPVMDSDGSVLVPLNFGGNHGDGTLARVSQAGGVSVDVDFGSPLGEHPAGSLFSYGGLFWGVAGHGGTADRGTFFLHSPGVATVTFASFTSSVGALPEGPPLLAADGNFYVAAREGGAFGKGAIVRLAPDGTRSTLVSFTGVGGAAHGERPRGPLAIGADGSLYGVTESGGATNDGTAFKVTLDGVLTTLAEFALPGPGTPLGGLVTGPDGNFYGTTSGGGTNDEGTVFRLTPTGTVTVLVAFTGDSSGSPGSTPTGPLFAALDGTLYGTTARSGPAGNGTIFKVSPSGLHTVLFSFTGNGGSFAGSAAIGDLTIAPDGFLYGAASQGGPRGGGTVFRVRQLEPHAGTDGQSFAPGVVTLDGYVQTGGEVTGVFFEYGFTPALGLSTASQSVGPGGSPVAFTAAVNGLPSSTTVYFRAKAANASGASTGLLRSFVVPGAMEFWKLAYFGDASTPDLGDFDADGSPNLLEYALGTLPTDPASGGSPAVVLHSYPDGARLSLTLRRDPSHNDITVVVEATGNLSGPWTSVAASVSGVPFAGPGYVGGDSATPGVKTVEIRDVVPSGTALQRFLRMRVTH